MVAITEKSALKAQETNRIRKLFRAICEIPGKPIEIELSKKREMGNEWESLEESNVVNSADQIGQLNALRFKMRPVNKNL